MSLRVPSLVSAPAVEPVALSDVKAFCKVDGTDEDTLLTSLMVSARRQCEEYTKRAFITQSWKLVLDEFSAGDEDCHPVLRRCDRLAIQLPRQPVQAVTSIKTTASDGTQTTVAPETYTLDQSGGRILLNDGYSWPSDVRDFAGIEIITENGYGDDGGDVPEPICQAIIQATASMYLNRACSDLPEGVKTLLSPFMGAEAFGAW